MPSFVMVFPCGNRRFIHDVPAPYGQTLNGKRPEELHIIGNYAPEDFHKFFQVIHPVEGKVFHGLQEVFLDE